MTDGARNSGGSRQRWPGWAAVAAGSVALLVLSVCALGGVTSWGRPDAGSWRDVAAEARGDLFQAANALAVMPGARYVGASATPEGKPVTVDARVSNEGSTLAAVTVGGRPARVLAAGDRVFVRADEEFWRGYGTPVEMVAQYARVWVRVASTRPSPVISTRTSASITSG